MIADRVRKLEFSSVLESELLSKKYESEIAAWTECYKGTWSVACTELAHCFKHVEAFLALPSNRGEVREALIASFSGVHPCSLNLSNLLDKPTGVRFGCFENVRAIMDQIIVNESLLTSAAKVTDLLLLDDWFGTGKTMFAFQAKLAALFGKDFASQCAVPGVARDQESIEEEHAIATILAATKPDVQI